MNQQNMVAKRKAMVDVAKAAVTNSAMTLATQGIDAEKFGAILQEAILANPDIVGADERSLARAVRKCCRDGIIPDGDQGALVIFKGEAVALPMVSGLMRMAVTDLGAEIRSGVVHDGDEVRIVEGVGVDPIIEITSGADVFKSRTSKNLIGAWCWIKLPFEATPRIVLFSQDQINRARAASRAKNGPWQTWPERMAEKSCIKSAIWRLRHLAHVQRDGGRVLRVIEDDNNAEYGDKVVDIDYHDVETAPVEVETKKEQPKARPADDPLKTGSISSPPKQEPTRREPERAPVTAEPFEPDQGDDQQGAFLPLVNADLDDDPTSL